MFLRRHVIRLLATTGVFLWLATIAPGRLAAQSSPYTPYQHKALYLFNFAKYTEWPREAFASDDAPFIIGIIGTDPFGKDIEIIKGKTIKGRKLDVRIFETAQKFKEAQETVRCQMVFISSSESNRLDEVMAVIGNSSILTIAEMDQFIKQSKQSGMIKLVGEQKNSGAMTVGFEINIGATERASLKLDTQLLKLAKPVKNQAG